ncbi:SDR family NAD(P)-dependent oxidoreductase [Streptomyces sp. NPDC060232]|uniref:SDR family NAD(P)-dependent oxidoreductase n=1 Tax=Streptomyces sp. NPDC060232 TaxID=3347079 RepID=UPI0036653038
MPASFSAPGPADPATTDIAIIGMVGTFPGAEGIDAFWSLLCEGRDGLTRFSAEELLGAGLPRELITDPSYVRAHGVIPDVELFDTALFGMTPAEAEMIDPQHRLFLQHCYAALEDAGYDPARFPGLISVYGGAAINTYLQNHVLPNVDQTRTPDHFAVMVGNDKDYLATRVAYKLDLKGSAYSVQTACSTSLVAIHLACQGLVNGECDMALAGGVTVKLPQTKGYLFEEGAILSADGVVRTFDAAASGTVLGNGVGVLVLKPLAAALAAGDTIHAVIKGTATNNDGALKVSYAAPGKEGQAAVIAEAHAVAGVAAETIGYVEAHGTATRLGDPVEVSALTQAFRAATDRTGFCRIGSVKSNVGHLDAAAGVAGVIKTALMLRHRTYVPTAHFRTPNPQIDFEQSPFRVAADHVSWDTEYGVPRRAGVSSFGIGGTNAHAVLEEAPQQEPTDPSRPNRLLVLSAKTPTALAAACSNLASHLRAHPGLEPDDIAFTLAVGRAEHTHRRAVVWHEAVDAADLLDAAARDEAAAGPVRAVAPLRFVFDSPDDAERRAAELVAREPGFKRHWTAARRAGAGRHGAAGSAFALQYALARHWLDLGLVPEAAHGDSVGRLAASCAAGGLTLKEAVAALGTDGRAEPARARIPRFPVRPLPVDMAEDDGAIVLGPDVRDSMDTVREAWLRGAPVDWNAHFAGAQRRRLPLPAYPFEGRRCWLPAGTQEPVPTGSGAVTRPHPLLDQNVSSLWEQRYVARRTGDEPYLADHVVAGRRVWPGAAYVEMARAAGELASGRRVTSLRGVTFERMLAFDGAEREVGVTLVPGDDATVAFEVGAEDGVCARGTLSYGPAPAEPARPLDLDGLRARLAGSAESDALYEAFARRGLAYGPTFRTLSGFVWDGDEALARVALDGEQGREDAQYVLHPSVLDGALQAAVALLVAQGAPEDAAYLPYALDEVEVVSAPGTAAVVHVRLTSGNARAKAITADITVTDAEGVPHALVRGLVIRSTSRQPEAGPPARTAGPEQAGAPLPSGEGAGQAGSVAAEAFLADILAAATKLDAADIDPDAPLESYGIDSLMITRLNGTLAEHFGDGLSRTLLFEYRTLAELAAYFLDEHADRTAALLTGGSTAPGPGRKEPVPALTPRPGLRVAEQPAASRPESEGAGDDAIAIIGVSGRYPMADDLEAFWRNLAEGRDCVTEVPAERWDHAAFHDPDREAVGRSYGRWGGFLSDVDKFDPLFFPIMPREAELMDPQERLFLETAWHTLEDAGYRRRDLRDAQVGVFVGVMYGEYQLYGAADALRGGRRVTNSSYASIANRVSHLLDLNGPSMAVDTMCSSSLTAIHLACESLRRGETDLAVAGGVNVSVHPYKYVFLSQGGYLSDDGRCRSFGDGGSGYVPGEGVGAVLLKPLRKAVEDGDHIHGVILGSALNHGGKTNGYTVPNPAAQERAVATALRRAGVAARDVSYVEAHGTGTPLGDPIEITGLSRAFGTSGGRAPDTAPVAVGSVKSNIGHLESAAGIAGLTKVLLQFKHRKIAPSLHAERPNPNIDLAAGGFRLQRELGEWSSLAADGRPRPRRAGLSSFGAGGSNAHLVLEEGTAGPSDAGQTADRQHTTDPLVFVLSARDEHRLRVYAGRIADFLERSSADLADIAHTLRCGREAMESRLVCVTADGGELARALRGFSDGAEPAGLQLGTAAPGAGRRHAAAVRAAAERGDDAELVQLWIDGADVEWRPAGRRIPLPGYPFARDRYWVPTDAGALLPELPTGRDRGTGHGRLLFRGDWEEHALPTGSGTQPDGVRMLFADGDAAATVRDHGAGAPTVLVRPGGAYRRDGAHSYTIDPGKAEDYVRLLEDCARDGLSPTVVLHMWNVPGVRQDRDGGYDAAALLRGTASLFPLGRALLARRPKHSVRLMVLHCEGPDGFSPVAEAAAGFARSVREENPRLLVQVVGADGPERLLEAAGRELAVSEDPEVLVRHRAGRRWVHLHRPVSPADAADAASRDAQVRDGGVYLITGGTGGLGLLVAQHLARRARVCLVLVSRSQPSDDAERRIAAMRAGGSTVDHLRADVADADEVEALVARVRREHGVVNGVVHAAGVLRDGFLLRKEPEDAAAVLAPKIAGTFHLDRATRTDPLDFFVLFSSIAAAFGNAGQTDYATANRFLDGYAAHRAGLAAAGLRSGRSVAVAWPHWSDGGMPLSTEGAAALLDRLGVVSLGTAEGLAAFDEALALDGELLVAAGDAKRLADRLARARRAGAPAGAGVPEPFAGQVGFAAGRTGAPEAEAGDTARARASAVALLRELVGSAIQADPADIAADVALLARYGIDSLAVTRLNRALEERLGAGLSKTLFFEYDTLDELADHLAGTRAAQLLPAMPKSAPEQAEPRTPTARATGGATTAAESEGAGDDAIAIIGVSGRYPMADDLEAFWRNLAEGRDCVTEVPAERWDHAAFHDPDREAVGRSYGRWGGFLSDVDKFDPLFFSVSPREAELMDPQERLFLETAWHTLEDAGYPSGSLSRRRVGVFVGVMYGEYQLYGAADALRGGRPVTESSYSLIANRVSYALDLNGPSMAVDTMCSSSLTAIHLACESLRRGESEMAVAGGVNVSVHPYKYVLLAQSRFLSDDGRCRSFGDGGSGYVPGEGVGAVLLKPLRKAVEDGDHIHGVILGSALNHGGRPSGSGLTVPNPRAQGELVGQALEAAGVDARTISYVEAHGTGTPLGDPIEITGLSRAFREHTADTGFCAIGSVKSNIGHLESAAGIAGLTKVLLQFKHRKIAPSLHAERPNPNIDFDAAPFTVQREPADWSRPVVGGVQAPRRAGVSSFGAGGANAHLVLEEPPARVVAEDPAGAQHTVERLVFVLSARDEDRLRAYAGHMADFLRREHVDLVDVAETLREGREPMRERLALVTSDGAELVAALAGFASGGTPQALLRGTVSDGAAVAAEAPGADAQDPEALAAAWVGGGLQAWPSRLRRGCRIPLPGYPFARERYWLPARPVRTTGALALHPLLDANESTVEEQRFRKTLHADDPLLRDHVIAGRPVLAAAAALELVRAAARRASVRPLLTLNDVVWGRPVTVAAERADVYAGFTADGPDRLVFEVYTEASGARIAHIRGHARYGAAEPADPADVLDLPGIRARCTGRRTGEQVDRDYAAAGFVFGEGFRTVHEVWAGPAEALAELRLPTGGADDPDLVLPPGLLDGALRTCHWIGRTTAPEASELAVPFGIGELRVHGPLPPVCYAHAEVTGGDRRAEWRYRVTVVDAEGRELARVDDIVGRLYDAAELPDGTAEASHPADAVPAGPAAADSPGEHLFYRPVWRETDLLPADGAVPGATLLVLAGRPGEADALGRAGGWNRVVEALPGDSFADLGGDRYTLDPAAPEQYRRLLEVVGSPSSGRIDVAHLWNREPHGADSGLIGATGLLSVLWLVQAAAPASVRIAYVYGAASPEAPAPEHEAVTGLALSARAAAPGCEVFTVRFGALREPDEAVRLAAELTSPSPRGGAEVRFAAGRRSVRGAERVVPATGAGSPLADRGVYVITGGGGGIGRLLARRLADRHRARLVLLGRSPLPAALRADLEARGSEVLGVRADVADRRAVRAALIEARGRFGRIDGVFHLAGSADTVPLTEADADGFRSAFDAKAGGLVNLDELTRSDDLAVFAVFSSVSGRVGDFGSGSYAAANRFVDAAVEARAAAVAAGTRTGRSLSLDWPLWEAGGMDAAVPQTGLAVYREATGMSRLTAEQALDALDAAWGLAADVPVAAPLRGDRDRIQRALDGAAAMAGPAALTPVAARAVTPAAADHQAGAARYAARLTDHLRGVFSRVLKVPADRMETTTTLDRYGIDSVMIMEVNSLLGRHFEGLRGTLLFEYRTVAALADHLVREHAEEVVRLFGGDVPDVRGVPEPARPAPAPAAVPARADRPARASVTVPAPAPAPAPGPVQASADEPIAIIGISGRYPQADDLEAFWDNLVEGRDCVTEIPADRWDADAHFDPDPDAPGRSYGRWGGFLDDIASFDSLFFSISPLQAKSMDPQERLFLQTAWAALEDAGYRPDTLPRPRFGDEGRDVGVFVGAMWDDYAVLGAEESFKGNHVVAMANRASIANQVSYFGDFRGPSVVVDTACSSSLVALHMACESLRRDECSHAIAGGVNVAAHPLRYVHLSRKRMLSEDGRCRSFGAGGTGYVPGEGVGAVVLKRLSRALADGDQVHAVIRSTAVNHGGRTNGLTVPNPRAQQALVEEALARAGVSARDIGYVEAHGTGTALGDPIEHTGLTLAFAAQTADRGFCALGSVKSAVGHLEGAAGIAGVTKAVLQLKHGRLAPSLHAEDLNPVIDFDGSPFRVQREAAEWPRDNGRPRRAGVSSFGAGGTNAHVILEEHVPEQEVEPGGAAELIVLSARDEERLREYAGRIADFLGRGDRVPRLADVAHTLQTGREAMAERLAFTAEDPARAAEVLAAYAAGGAPVGLVRGSAGRQGVLSGLFTEGAGGSAFLAALASAGQWDKLAGVWVSGVDLDWAALRPAPARRVSLPTYPYARVRHWLTPALPAAPAAAPALPAVAGTRAGAERHVPLVLRPEDRVVADHVVSGRSILPGTGYLDLVLDALDARTGERTVDDVYWLAPVVVGDVPVHLDVVSRQTDRGLEFEVQGAAGAVHARGVLAVSGVSAPPPDLPLELLREECPRSMDGESFYRGMARLNVSYGPWFRLVERLWTDGAQVLARVRLPERFLEGAELRALHAAVADAALHSVAALHFDVRGTDDLPLLPFAVDRVRAYRPVPTAGWVHVSPLGGDRYDIALADEQGRVCVGFEGLAVREQRDPHPQFVYRPRWVPTAAPAGPDAGRAAADVLIAAPAGAAEAAEAVARNHPQAAVRRLEIASAGAPADAGALLPADGRPLLVYFLAGFDGPDGTEPSRAEARRVGPGALLGLAKALGRYAAAGAEVRLKVVTADAFALREDEAARPWAAAVAGLCSALEKERPELRIAHVDVRAGEAAGAAARIAAEPFPTPVRPVLLRDSVRYERSLEKLRLPEPRRRVPRRGGVYAIVGGLGVIGHDTALHLAREYGARLLVLGRGALDAARRERLAAIEKAGGEVLYERCDAADPAAVRKAVSRAKKRFGALHGVIHSVMDFRTAAVADLDEGALDAVLDSKEATLLGVWEAVRDEALDFFVHYSSGAAFQGAAHQGAYAAACCLADATAAELARSAPFPVRTVDWGFWHAAGIEEREQVLRPLTAAGVTPIGAEDGMRTLERFLATSVPRILAVRASDRLLGAMGVAPGAEVRPRPERLPARPAPRSGPAVLAADDRMRIETHQRAAREAEELAGLLLVGALRRMGVLLAEGEHHTEEGLRDRLGIAEQYRRLHRSVLDMLTDAGYLRRDGTGWTTTAAVVAPRVLRTNERPAAAAADLAARYPGIAAVATLLERCLEAFPRVVTGAESHIDVLFPNGSMDMVVGVYRGNAVSDACNTLVADAVRGLVEERAAGDTGARIRVLEVGAGTGSTSGPVLEALASYADVEFTYTDVTSAFVRHGRREFAARYPFAEFKVFDIDADPVAQGIAPDGYDIVLGTNVFHVTPFIEHTLLRAKRLLRAGGVLIANEGTGFAAYLPLIFGLTSGWWMYRDADYRIPGSPLLTVGHWRDVLAACGFEAAEVRRLPDTAEGPVEQCLILAESDGIVPAAGALPADAEGPSGTGAEAQDPPVAAPVPTADTHAADLGDVARRRVTAAFARVLEMAEGQFDPEAPFEDYGIDSIVVPQLKQALEADFGRLPAPLLFEHTTIGRLAAHFEANYADTLARLDGRAPLDAPDPDPSPAAESAVPVLAPAVGQAVLPPADAPRHAGKPDLESAVAALSDDRVDELLGRLLSVLGDTPESRRNQ